MHRMFDHVDFLVECLRDGVATLTVRACLLVFGSVFGRVLSLGDLFRRKNDARKMKIKIFLDFFLFVTPL